MPDRARYFRRQYLWDQYRETLGTVLLYLCFIAYVPFVVVVATAGLSLWWLTAILIPVAIAAAIKGEV